MKYDSKAVHIKCIAICIFLFHFGGIFQEVFSNDSTCKNSDNSGKQERGKCLVGYSIRTIQTSGVLTCIKECLVRQHCLSVNFNTKNYVCVLNNKNASTITDLSSCDNYVYSDIQNWEQVLNSSIPACNSIFEATTSLVKVCANHDCPMGTRCVPLFRGSYTCLASECVSQPSYRAFLPATFVMIPGKPYVLTCSNGVDTVTISCDTSGTWTSIPDECLSTSCDFENGWCDWTQDITDDFDWETKTGSTLSAGTGPTSDHTTGSGTYIYTESTGQDDYVKPRLHSKEFPGTGSLCLTFWYHMYGGRMGTLNVNLKKSGQNGTTLFSLQGDQGTQWHKANVEIPPQDMAYHIEFEGILTDYFTSDMALDDIIVNTVCA